MLLSGRFLPGQPPAQPLSLSAPHPCPESSPALLQPRGSLSLCLALCSLLSISDPTSFCFLSCSSLSPFLSPASLLSPHLTHLTQCLLVSPSAVPKTILGPAQTPLNTCHPPPTPLPPAPVQPRVVPPPPPPAGSHHSPLGATHPQQHSAKHQASGTLPILRAPRKRCQTFLRSCWAPCGGGGRAGLSPALPPSSRLPGLGTARLPRLGPRTGSPPRPPPSLLPSLLLSLPDFRLWATLSPPLAPPLPPPTSWSPGGHLGLEGLTLGGEDQPCLKGAPEGG